MVDPGGVFALINTEVVSIEEKGIENSIQKRTTLMTFAIKGKVLVGRCQG
jgi:hypothetical protein